MEGGGKEGREEGRTAGRTQGPGLCPSWHSITGSCLLAGEMPPGVCLHPGPEASREQRTEGCEPAGAGAVCWKNGHLALGTAFVRCLSSEQPPRPHLSGLGQEHGKHEAAGNPRPGAAVSSAVSSVQRRRSQVRGWGWRRLDAI